MDRLKLSIGFRKTLLVKNSSNPSNTEKSIENTPPPTTNEDEMSALSLSHLNSPDATNFLDRARRPARPLSLRLPTAKDNEENEPDLYKLLAENKLTEQDVWEGAPTLFPILYQFRNSLIEAAMQNPEQVVTSFQLPSSVAEFSGTGSKAYKINTKFTTSQTISLICKKFNVQTPQQFCLVTPRGFILNDHEPLAAYGLGTLFKKWELCLKRKDQMYHPLKKSIEAPTTFDSSAIVVFELPPLREFSGLKKKVFKVETDTTIDQILKGICNKYNIPDHTRFSVLMYSSTCKQEILLCRGATLSNYGIGFNGNKSKWVDTNHADEVTPESKPTPVQDESPNSSRKAKINYIGNRHTIIASGPNLTLQNIEIENENETSDGHEAVFQKLGSKSSSKDKINLQSNNAGMKWELSIVFTELTPPHVIKHLFPPLYGWIHNDQIWLDKLKSRVLITELDTLLGKQLKKEKDADYPKQISTLKLELEHSKNVINQTNQKLELVTQQLDLSDENLRSTKKDLEREKASNSELSKQYKDLFSKYEDTLQELHFCRGSLSEVKLQSQQRIESFQSTTENLKIELENSKFLIGKNRAANLELTRELEATKIRLEESSSDLNHAKNSITNLELELNQAKQKNTEINEQLNITKNQLSIAKEEINTFSVRMSHFENNETRLNQEIKTLVNENQLEKNRADENMNEIDSLRSNEAHLQIECDQSRRLLQDAQEKLAKTQEKLEEAQNQLSEKLKKMDSDNNNNNNNNIISSAISEGGKKGKKSKKGKGKGLVEQREEAIIAREKAEWKVNELGKKLSVLETRLAVVETVKTEMEKRKKEEETKSRELDTQLREKQIEITKLELEISEFVTKLQMSESKYQDLQTLNSNLQKSMDEEIKGYRSREKEIRSKMTHLEQLLDEEKTNANSWVSKFEDEVREKEDLNLKCSGLVLRLEESHREIGKMLATKGETERLLLDLETKNAELEKELQETKTKVHNKPSSFINTSPIAVVTKPPPIPPPLPMDRHSKLAAGKTPKVVITENIHSGDKNQDSNNNNSENNNNGDGDSDGDGLKPSSRNSSSENLIENLEQHLNETRVKLKPIIKVVPTAKERQINTIADIIFNSLQSRFSSIQEDVEDLGDDLLPDDPDDW